MIPLVRSRLMIPCIHSMKKKLLKALFTIILVVGLVLTGIWIYIAQPTLQKNTPSKLSVDRRRLEEHVTMLSEAFHPRNYSEIENLRKTKEYIANHFESAGAKVKLQNYDVSNQVYSNVIGSFGEGKGRKVIVGAHYDSYENTPGADDNASGVSGLLELAYLFGSTEVEREVELVAYTLEEPPFFGSDQMGSYIHASSLNEGSEEITGVVVLEMIGYFSDTRNSQGSPALLFKLIYPKRGNFIAVVGRLDHRAFTKRVKVGMKGATDLPVYSINAPRKLPGIDFSDHRNYWPFGMNAVMVTDTAFYRNKEYHGPGDTSDRLDFDKMAKVVVSVFESIVDL